MVRFDEILEKVKEERQSQGFCMCHECTHRAAESQYFWEQFKEKQDEMFERIKNDRRE